MQPLIKMCGLKTADDIKFADSLGVDFIGLVHYPKSPRHLDADAAKLLAATPRDHAKIVLLLVNPRMDKALQLIDHIKPDYVQLHGSESSEFCTKMPIPVIKALKTSELYKATDYNTDYLLIEPSGGTLPGGNGKFINVDEVKDFAPKQPWLLAGGLSCDNVADAVAAANPNGVDVSSGIERTKGIKDQGLMQQFIKSVKL